MWIFDEIKRIKSDKEMMSRIYMITLGVALLILVLVLKGPEEKGQIISDSNGNAVSIKRYSTEKSESYRLVAEIKKGSETIARDVNLSIQAVKEGRGADVLSDETDSNTEMEMALDAAINDIEYSKSKTIRLPDELSDGSKVRWEAGDKKDYTIFFLIPFIYLALIIFVVRAPGDKLKTEIERKKQSILKGLPRFCNQLFLMMNAGLILSDAFEKITDSYALRLDAADEEKENDYFESELVRIKHDDPSHRSSTASLIHEFAVSNDVKEMIRIATILTENEKRGSDVIESLSRESRYLWDERKVVAREKGKMIDSKMSYPLGILLILLIVITMAPAMLSM
jgi:hypothetical protein